MDSRGVPSTGWRSVYSALDVRMPEPETARCIRCGDAIIVGDGDRFQLRALDRTDGTVATHVGRLCSHCWGAFTEFMEQGVALSRGERSSRMAHCSGRHHGYDLVLADDADPPACWRRRLQGGDSTDV
jgi:hypothetical protein